MKDKTREAKSADPVPVATLSPAKPTTEPEAEAEGPDYEEVEKDPLFRLTYFNTNRIVRLRQTKYGTWIESQCKKEN